MQWLFVTAVMDAFVQTAQTKATLATLVEPKAVAIAWNTATIAEQVFMIIAKCIVKIAILHFAAGATHQCKNAILNRVSWRRGFARSVN